MRTSDPARTRPDQHHGKHRPPDRPRPGDQPRGVVPGAALAGRVKVALDDWKGTWTGQVDITPTRVGPALHSSIEGRLRKSLRSLANNVAQPYVACICVHARMPCHKVVELAQHLWWPEYFQRLIARLEPGDSAGYSRDQWRTWNASYRCAEVGN